MLQESDALAIRVSEQFSIDCVVGDSQLSSVVTISHMNDFDAVWQNWQTVCLEKTEHHHVVGTAFYADDRVEGPVEFAQFVLDAASVIGAAF